MAKRYSGPVFTMELPLKIKKNQADRINRRMEAGRQMYNALAGKMLKRYKEMIKTKRYRTLKSQLSSDKDKNKEIWTQIIELYIEYGFTEFDFQSAIKPMQHHYKKAIDSTIAQKIASEVWKAFDKLLYENGTRIHFKKYGELNTLEAKSTKNGIKYTKGDKHIDFMGLVIPFIIEEGNQYETDAMKLETSFCRITRREIRGQYKYYVQFVLRGLPPIKYDKKTGLPKRYLGEGDVGNDIGTSTIAYVSENDVKIKELAPNAQAPENEKRRILRAMDRSKRVTNPQNYNADGTIKSGKLEWHFSNHYKKLKSELKEIYRKQAAIRKYEHECMTNEILKQGNTFYVEKMNFSGLAKRAKETKHNDKGKFVSKKRFGKSVANRAPAMFIRTLARKANALGGVLIEINTIKARASQFSHLDQTYKKKKLSQRWNYFDGLKVQRDLYSAFLIMCIASDLETFDLEKCNKRFENFLRLHNLEVERLSGNKNLSCIAI